MGLFLEHVNTLLAKLRADPISSLSTDTTSEAYKAQMAVRRAVWRVWNAKQWGFKLRVDTAFNTTASQESYVLRKYIGEPVTLKIDEAPYILTGITEETKDRLVPNAVETGVPAYYSLFELRGCSNQPSSASTLTVYSSSASDTTQTVYVKGIVSGEIKAETVALAGTSQISTTNSYTTVLSITKSAITEGVVNVNAGATTVETLSQQEFTIRRRVLRLYPIPADSYDITVKHFAHPPFLTNAYEDTEIPFRWDYVVDQWAYALGLQTKGQEQLAEQTTALQLAKIFLEDDMAAEEFISSDTIIVPQKWGEAATDNYFPQLSGYGITYT